MVLAHAKDRHPLPKLRILEVRGPLDNVSSGQFDWLHFLAPPSLAELSLRVATTTPHHVADVDTSVAFAGSILEKCPCLRVLTLFGDHENAAIQRIPSVIFNRLPVPTELRTLHLDDQFINSGFLKWVAKIPLLEDLQLGHLMDDHAALFKRASFPPSSFSTLETLDLVCDYAVESCISLWNTCLVRQLTTLNLSCPLFSLDQFRVLLTIIVANSPQITSLRLYAGIGEDDDSQGIIRLFGVLIPLSLRCLTLDFFMDNCPDPASHIVRNWPGLTQLALPRQFLYLEELGRIILGCPSLSSLTFHSIYDQSSERLPRVPEPSAHRLTLNFLLYVDFRISPNFLAR